MVLIAAGGRKTRGRLAGGMAEIQVRQNDDTVRCYGRGSLEGEVGEGRKTREESVGRRACSSWRMLGSGRKAVKRKRSLADRMMERMMGKASMRDRELELVAVVDRLDRPRRDVDCRKKRGLGHRAAVAD
jgi:hypothetical protein